MSKKNIYLVQPSNKISNAVYLPYSSGCIAAYAFSFDYIKERYNLCNFIYEKKPLEEAIEEFDNPYFAGFSCYLWNIEYNLALAELLKKKYPEVIIAFGGPQIPDDTEYLEKYSFISILMNGEGEITFCELLKSFSGDKDLSDLKGISYRAGEKLIHNAKGCPSDIKDFPSPYSSGYFDSIVENPKNAGVQFDVVLETNRGCPFSCSYCYWSDSGKHFREFSMERVKADIDWIAKHQLPYVFCADGNFGILERDFEIADYIIESKKRTGYPQKLETTMTKKKNGKVFQMAKKMEDAGLNRGVSFAVQSFTPEVQKISNRVSPSYDLYKEWLALYADSDIPVYTDLILGLPGETYESFCDGIFKILETEIPITIQVNKCELLPNTQLNTKEFVEKYKIRTIESNQGQNHIEPPKDKVFGTRSNMVVETESMPMVDWKRSLIMSCYVQTFYSLGLLKNIISYVVHDCGVSYKEFFNSLVEMIEEKSVFIKKMTDKYFSFIDDFLDSKGGFGYLNSRYGNMLWPIDEGLFLEIIMEIDPFFEELKEFLKVFISDDEILTELVDYQKKSIIIPGKTSEISEFNHTWMEYYNGEKLITAKRCYKFIAEDVPDDPEEYAKDMIWWHHRELKAISKVEIV